MSNATESPPSPATTTESPPPPTAEEPKLQTVRDMLFWRRKVLNVIVLLAATAVWVLLDIYQFNFITVASWAAMFVVSFLFLLGNISRLLGKEPPNMSVMEIDEQSATKMAHTLREWIEDSLRWMLRVGVEREWYIFAGLEASLYMLSLVAQLLDFPALLFIGVVLGLSVPTIYMKYEYKIKESGRRLRMQCERCCGMINEKLRKIRHKMVHHEEKVKKTE